MPGPETGAIMVPDAETGANQVPAPETGVNHIISPETNMKGAFPLGPWLLGRLCEDRTEFVTTNLKLRYSILCGNL